jgi:hypothetical protein
MTSKARGRKKRSLESIHPSAPKKLVREYKKLGCNQLALSKQLQVNDFYINRLLKDGVEPTNPEIRVKLFLPRIHRKSPTPRPEEWTGQKRVKRKVAKMAKETREPESYKQEIHL